MTISYLPAPIPKWIIVDNNGDIAGGAKLYTKSNLDPDVNKAVYQDSAGSIPYTNPIDFDANGTAGPFYWEVNDADDTDTYYIYAEDANGNFLWDVQNFIPPGSGGGGGGGTTVYNLNNLVTNNMFIDHVGTTGTAINVSSETNYVLAPSNHYGFTPDTITPVIGTYGAVGPDIRFVKNNTAATDSITFTEFVAGTTLTGDVTPVEYLRFQCTGAAPGSETYKAIQIPICHKVENIADQAVTFTVWAKVTATAVNITASARQFFGNGNNAPSAEVVTLLDSNSVSTSWQKLVFQGTIPSIAGKTLGNCGDDALYIQIGLPLNAACDILLTKPCLYVGNNYPTSEFQTYDQIASVTTSPRTADMKTTMRPTNQMGWVPMNNGTIGSTSSGASNRANIDTFALYKTLWDGVTDTWAPVSGGRGASAVADFAANKTLTLTQMLGRVLMGQNANFSAELQFTADAATDVLTVSSTTNLPTDTPVVVRNTGGALPAGLSADTLYFVSNQSATTLKLLDSLNGTVVDITDAGSGTNYVVPAFGSHFGEGKHTLSISEMPAHNHPGSTITVEAKQVGLPNQTGALNSGVGTSIAVSVASQGGGLPHNNVQPSLIGNVLIKL